MPTFRRALFPACPVCHKTGGLSVHDSCRKPTIGKESPLWLDIETGTTKCGTCGKTWSMETAKHNCSCGAVFKGGQIWQGMKEEYEKYANHEWMQRLEITKGSLETEIWGIHKCFFCGNWDQYFCPDKHPLAAMVHWSYKAAICSYCVIKYSALPDRLYQEHDKRKSCFFCYEGHADVDSLMTDKGISICNRCLTKYRKLSLEGYPPERI